jgi:hypothetical protein
MLMARATSEACRADFSDVIRGLSYTTDEVIDMTPPPAITPTSGLNRQKAPRRDPAGERDEGPDNASDAGLAKGVAELEARLLDLDLADRNRFKDWRKATGMEWPPPTLRDFAAMVSEVARIEEDAALDADTYDG